MLLASTFNLPIILFYLGALIFGSRGSECLAPPIQKCASTGTLCVHACSPTRGHSYFALEYLLAASQMSCTVAAPIYMAQIDNKHNVIDYRLQGYKYKEYATTHTGVNIIKRYMYFVGSHVQLLLL